jgi:nitroreductase
MRDDGTLLEWVSGGEEMSMDVLEAIRTRRSIHEYTTEIVSEELINKLLAAAMNAPSAGNEQPWHFVVIRERQTLDAILKFHPYSGSVKSASVAILVCGDERLEKYRGYWVQDCAAATQNLLLAAHGQGLGAVWMGVTPDQERVIGFRRLLGIPDEVTPFSLVSVGYPVERKSPEDRYNGSRVRYGKW